jgi:hypothetical protein
MVDSLLSFVMEELFIAKSNVINSGRMYFDLRDKSGFNENVFNKNIDFSWNGYLLLLFKEIEDHIKSSKGKIIEINKFDKADLEYRNIFISCLFDEILKTIRDSASVYNNKYDFINDVSVVFDLYSENIKIEYYNLAYPKGGAAIPPLP